MESMAFAWATYAATIAKSFDDDASRELRRYQEIMGGADEGRLRAISGLIEGPFRSD